MPLKGYADRQMGKSIFAWHVGDGKAVINKGTSY